MLLTDAEGRGHGIDNLCAAGRSLFPASGRAVPTPTIAALAQRTTDTSADRACSPASEAAPDQPQETG